MTAFTFALLTPSETHYLDASRADGDDRTWRDIVLEVGVRDGLITVDEALDCSVLPAERPKPPHATWR